MKKTIALLLCILLLARPALAVNTTIPYLVAHNPGVAMSANDAWACRQGTQTSDSGCSASLLKTFTSTSPNFTGSASFGGAATFNAAASFNGGVNFSSATTLTAPVVFSSATTFGNIIPTANSGINLNAGLLATVAAINAKTVANTAIYTVPTGKTLVVTAAVIRCSAASSITVAPTLGIGNAAGTSNIFAATSMSGLTTTGADYSLTLSGASVTTAAAGIVYLNLTTASTGTSQVIVVDLYGYLI